MSAAAKTPMAAPIAGADHVLEKPSTLLSTPTTTPTTSATTTRIAMICHHGIGPEFATARA